MNVQGGPDILLAMNKAELIGHLEDLDRALTCPATLHVYGSAACILLDEPDLFRTVSGFLAGAAERWR